MNVEVMRRLILEADTHQIDDKIIDAANVQTMADIDKLITDFNDAKKTELNSDESTKNITDWANSKK